MEVSMIHLKGKLPTEISTINTHSRELMKFKNAELCIYSETPTLGMILREKGERVVLDYLVAWLISINEKLNVARPMPPNTLEECAFFIYQNYPHLNMADINLVFTRVLTGEGEKLYEGISMAKVLKWFLDYNEERMLRGAELSRVQHEKYESEPRTMSDRERNIRLGDIAGCFVNKKGN